jgi:hypothetical protein
MPTVKSSVIVFARAATGVKAINPIITTARANLHISVPPLDCCVSVGCRE